ncbi:MAG TPA: hypothetical protein VF407_12390 [Polyangiaceae bacterium]
MNSRSLLFVLAAVTVSLGACSSSSSSGGSSGGSGDDGNDNGGGNTTNDGGSSGNADGGATSDGGGGGSDKDAAPAASCDLFTCTTSADCGGIAPCFSTLDGVNYCYEQEGSSDECSAGTVATNRQTSNGSTVICVPSNCPTPQKFLE